MNPIVPTTVLALDLHPLSYGFAVFEGPKELIDWGIRSFRHGVHAVKVPMPVKLERLFDQYEPQVVVIRTPKTAIVQSRVRTIAALVKHRQIAMRQIPDATIRLSFPHRNQNKYQIAEAIAERFPELSPRLRARRKTWQAERYSMSIFDAAAIGIAYFMRDATNHDGIDRALSSLSR